MYLLWVAYQMKAPLRIMVSMLVILGIEALLGAIPLLGILIDVAFKANIISLRMLQAYERNHPIPLEVDE
jgi:hypothetical protein